MNPTCSLPEKRHWEILRHFDGITEEEENEIRTMFPQYLFFRNEFSDDGWQVSGPVRICTCTSCGESFPAVRGNYRRGKLHHEKCDCPNCRKSVEGIAVSKYGWDMKSLWSYVKTAVARPAGDGGLLVEAGIAERSFSHEDLTGTILWIPTKRYYLNLGCIQMWEHRQSACQCFGFDATEYRWVPKKTVGDPFQPNVQGYCDYHGEYAVVGLNGALRESDFRYCQIGDFFLYNYGAELDEKQPARWIVKYLAWYALHPQIEMAVKFGIEEAVHELITDGRKNAALLNWSGTRPDEFLRMSKQDAKAFLRWGMDWKDLKNWRETGGEMSLREFMSLRERLGGQENLAELAACAKAAGVGMRRAERYAESMMPACRSGNVSIETILRFWKDYLGMAKQLDFDLKEETVAMPKNLRERHDSAAEIIRHQASESEMKRYRKRRRRLEKKYCFRLGELCVLVPTGSEEIVREGRTLRHCVGGYAARHIEGKTTILFIRKWKTPGRSFLTVEVYEDRGKIRIRQIHGYKNEGYHPALKPSEKYAWFLEPWLQWVNNGSKRERDGKPALPAEETDEKMEVQAV